MQENEEGKRKPLIFTLSFRAHLRETLRCPLTIVWKKKWNHSQSIVKRNLNVSLKMSSKIEYK